MFVQNERDWSEGKIPGDWKNRRPFGMVKKSGNGRLPRRVVIQRKELDALERWHGKFGCLSGDRVQKELTDWVQMVESAVTELQKKS